MDGGNSFYLVQLKSKSKRIGCLRRNFVPSTNEIAILILCLPHGILHTLMPCVTCKHSIRTITG